MNDSTPNSQWAPPSGPPTGPADFQMFGAVQGQGPATLTETSVRRGPGRHLGRLGLAAALVVTAGVGGFAVTSALSNPAGAPTPGAAFEQFFVAVDNEDLAGVLELMPPGERASLVEPTAAVMRQLQRLEVLDPGADTSALTGFDLTVEGVSYTVEQLDPRLAWVTTTGGTVTTANVDLELMPFGTVIDDVFDAVQEAAGEMSLEDQMSEVDDEVADLGADPFSLAVIEEGGSWYVSLMYTVAESARHDSGMLFPGLGNGPTPVGGATPGDALKGMVEQGVDLDLGGVISYLDPVEMAALYDYSPLFLDDADAGAQSFKEEVATLTLERIETRSWERNGRTMATIDGFAGRIQGIDPFGGEPLEGSFDFDGDCSSVTINGESQQLCNSDTASPLEGGDPQEMVEDLFDELGIDLSTFQDLTVPEQGVTVVERDGRWYVSMVPSMMYPVAETLEQLDAEAFGDLVDAVETLVENGAQSFLGLQDETFDTTDPFPQDGYGGETSFGLTVNYVVEQTIPAGTPSEILLSGGYVSIIEVDDPDVSTVWDIDSEIGFLVALRDIGVGEVLRVEDFGNAGFVDEAPMEDSQSSGTTDNYRVEKPIPAGTPGAVLLSEGYVSVFEVDDAALAFETVWYLDLEIGDLVALRDIPVGGVLLVEDFG